MSSRSTNIPETEEQKKERIFEAFNIAKNNSYLKRLYGDAQLFYLFMCGMKYMETGEFPKDLLEDGEFLRTGGA